MRDVKGTGLALATAVAMAVAPALQAEERDGDRQVLRIGIVRTLFRNAPDAVLRAMGRPFTLLLESQTGMHGDVQAAASATNLGRMLNDGIVDLGIFQGIEFAWAQQKYPSLRPLMIVVNQDSHLYACLVVRAGRGLKSVADLRGKRLALPAWSRIHCRLFLQRLCREAGATSPQTFFKSVRTSGDAEDVLDDVVDGKVDAALVEKVPLRCYRRRKPGRVEHLEVMRQSQAFPASVVAYRPGSLDREILHRFRRGMLRAAHLPMGRQLLTLWKLTGFLPVPDDFDENLRRILKIYPGPDAAPRVARAANLGSQPPAGHGE